MCRYAYSIQGVLYTFPAFDAKEVLNKFQGDISPGRFVEIAKDAQSVTG